MKRNREEAKIKSKKEVEDKQQQLTIEVQVVPIAETVEEKRTKVIVNIRAAELREAEQERRAEKEGESKGS